MIKELNRHYPGIEDALESGFALAIDGEVIVSPGNEKLTKAKEYGKPDKEFFGQADMLFYGQARF